LPQLPDAHGIAALALTILALILFTRDRIPLETSSLLILATLGFGSWIFPYGTGESLISPADFFSAFGNESLITICALMTAAKGLEMTGALQPLVRLASSGWSKHPRFSMLMTLLVVAVLSGFLNNTPIVIMLLPVLVSVALRSGSSTSGMLMPMGFATIVGGMATTIGTSTNLLVVGIVHDRGIAQLGMFDFVLPVAIVGPVAILFLWLAGPRLLPQRSSALADISPRVFNALFYVDHGSAAANKTLSEVLAMTNSRMKVERIQRGDNLSLTRLPSATVKAGDRLFVRDTVERLKEFENILGARLYNASDSHHPVSDEFPLSAGDQQLAEVVVTRGSPLHHRSLKQTRFATRYRLLPLAIHRARLHVDQASGELGDVRLSSGDVLLVQGSRENVNELRDSGEMLVLDGTTDLPRKARSNRALLIMAGIVGAAATGVLPISVSSVTGVALMIVSGCLRWRDVGQSLSAQIILVIVASLGLGLALTETGAADYLARLFVFATSGLPVAGVLSALILALALVTNVVTNNAAAVIGTPIAVGIANQLGAPVEPFLLAVIFGANMSFATPMGYSTNLLVMSAGGYRFADFIRLGIPLTILMWVGFSIVLMLMYQL
jgi:di/tricarboxylate transporter